MICSASIRPLYCVHRIAVLLAATWAYYEEKIAAHHFGIYHPWFRKSRKWVPIHFSYWAIFLCSFVTDFCCDGCELSQVFFCTILLSYKKQHQWTIEVLVLLFDKEFRFIECLPNVLFTLSKINIKRVQSRRLFCRHSRAQNLNPPSHLHWAWKAMLSREVSCSQRTLHFFIISGKKTLCF